jgi:hypothetical protein
LQQVQEYARRNAEQAEEDGLDDERRALLLALHSLAEKGKEQVMPKEIKEAMAAFMEDEEHAAIKPSWIGYRLREFGLQRKRTRQGSLYPITKEVILDLMCRYGVEVPASL